MWIIFDLDDTLIDTSGSITPIVLEQAFSAMREGGLDLKDPKESYRDLLAINGNSLSSHIALSTFAKKYGVSEGAFEKGVSALRQPKFLGNVTPIAGALELLNRLNRTHHLALVTRGYREMQLEKMARAGIDQALFKTCYFCPQENKKKYYQKIALDEGIKGDNIWVCGDRIELDLTPAKELGYRTVLLKWGRGRGNAGLKRDVDYTISYLRELEVLIKKYVG